MKILKKNYINCNNIYTIHVINLSLFLLSPTFLAQHVVNLNDVSHNSCKENNSYAIYVYRYAGAHIIKMLACNLVVFWALNMTKFILLYKQ